MVESIKEAVHSFAVAVATAVGLGAAGANYVYIFLISMIPVVELRGAIPVAFALGAPLIPAFITSVIGNMLPIPFILWFITPVCNMLKKTKLFAWFPRFMERHVEKRRDKITKYAKWGLFIFVAIPLPGTGAWTGALVASFLDFKFKDAFLSIFFGVITAGVIMSLLSYGVLGLIF